MINLEGIDLLNKKEKELFFDLGMGFTYSELGVKHGVHKNTIAKKVSELRRKLSTVRENSMFIIDNITGEDSTRHCINMENVALAAEKFLGIVVKADNIGEEGMSITTTSYSQLVFETIEILCSSVKKKIVFTIDDGEIVNNDPKCYMINYYDFEKFINEVSAYSKSSTELTVVTTSGNFNLRVKK